MAAKKAKRVMKPRVPKPPEPEFRIGLTVPASKLGPLLALLDNKYDVEGVHLVKEMEPGRNHPKGTMRQMMAELIKAAGGAIHNVKLKQQLVDHGFTKGSVQTQLLRYVKEDNSEFTKDHDGIIREKGSK